MANEKFTQLPTVVSSQLTDVIAAVQAGVSVQETLQQVFTLMLSNIILHNAGNPNGMVAGVVYQLCWDTANNKLYTCTTSGNAATAVWKVSSGLPIVLGSAGTIIRSNGTEPVYTTSTFADTYAASSLLYSNGANTVIGLATSNSSALVTSLTGVPTWLGPLTNGQVVIGSTGAIPVASTITGSSGITVNLGPGTINIEGGGSGYTWTEVTGTTQSMSVDTGYIANNAALVTLTLPSTAIIGDTVIVQGKGSGLFRIAQNSGQIIHFGNTPTTIGVAGSITSTNQFDSIELLCIEANTTWSVLTGVQGTFTVA